MSADLLIYGIVAAGLIFWLRSILGTKHDDERQRPNPFAGGEEKTDNVRRLSLNEDQSGVAENAERELPRNTSIENMTAEKGIGDIARINRNFDAVDFLIGSQDAFTIIVEAFADGDKKTLKGLLSEPVYKAFESVIDDRNEKGEEASVEIHAVRKADIIDARIAGKMAYITVRFTADETNVLRDKDGKVLYGNPDRITETIDIWTFGQPVKSRDPVWYLYETRDEDAAEEDHKTVPDAEKDSKDVPEKSDKKPAKKKTAAKSKAKTAAKSRAKKSDSD